MLSICVIRYRYQSRNFGQEFVFYSYLGPATLNEEHVLHAIKQLRSDTINGDNVHLVFIVRILGSVAVEAMLKKMMPLALQPARTCHWAQLDAPTLGSVFFLCT